MTREPDRYDKQAEEIVDRLNAGLEGYDQDSIAAALRASHDAALDEAEAAFREWGNTTRDTRDVFEVLADVRRALASPAAAPAAVLTDAERDAFYAGLPLPAPAAETRRAIAKERGWSNAEIDAVEAPPSEPAAPALEPETDSLVVCGSPFGNEPHRRTVHCHKPRVVAAARTSKPGAGEGT